MKLKQIVLLALVFAPVWGWAKEYQFEYYSPEQSKRILVTLIEHDGKKISKNCQKNGKVSCLAASALQKRNVSSSSKRNLPLTGHPAAINCRDQGASNRLIKDTERRETDICYFKDGSFVDAWDLYNANN